MAISSLSEIAGGGDGEPGGWSGIEYRRLTLQFCGADLQGITAPPAIGRRGCRFWLDYGIRIGASGPGETAV